MGLGTLELSFSRPYCHMSSVLYALPPDPLPSAALSCACPAWPGHGGRALLLGSSFSEGSGPVSWAPKPTSLLFLGMSFLSSLFMEFFS